MKTNTISWNTWDKTDLQITLLCLLTLSKFFLTHNACFSLPFYSLCCLACTSSSMYCIFNPPSTIHLFSLYFSLLPYLFVSSLLSHSLPSLSDASAAINTWILFLCSRTPVWSLSSTEYLIIIVPRSHCFPDHIACVLREKKDISRRVVKSRGQT